MPVSHKYKALFFHIPKTAGTSIEQMLEIDFRNPEKRDNLYSANPINAYQHFLPKDVRNTLNNYIGADATDNIFNTYTKFTVIRNPYERTISSFHYLSRKDIVGHLNDVTWDSNLKDRSSLMNGFSKFLEYSYDKVRKHENDDSFDIAPLIHHFRPQRHWFNSENNIYDNVMHFECLQDEIKELGFRLGCKKGFPHAQVTKRDLNIAWKDYYDKNNLLLFEKVYGPDLNVLGYQY